MKNWKTTLIGSAGAMVNLIANGVNWKSAALSVTLTLLGLASKDLDVTGVGPSARRNGE